LERSFGSQATPCLVEDKILSGDVKLVTGGVEALKYESRREPNRKNRVSQEMEEAVVTMAHDEPAWGQVRVRNELRQRGIFLSGCGVRCVWRRHALETMEKPLKALEERVAKEGMFSLNRTLKR
jgi:hypothetical protein